MEEKRKKDQTKATRSDEKAHSRPISMFLIFFFDVDAPYPVEAITKTEKQKKLTEARLFEEIPKDDCINFLPCHMVTRRI